MNMVFNFFLSHCPASCDKYNRKFLAQSIQYINHIVIWCTKTIIVWCCKFLTYNAINITINRRYFFHIAYLPCLRRGRPVWFIYHTGRNRCNCWILDIQQLLLSITFACQTFCLFFFFGNFTDTTNVCTCSNWNQTTNNQVFVDTNQFIC